MQYKHYNSLPIIYIYSEKMNFRYSIEWRYKFVIIENVYIIICTFAAVFYNFASTIIIVIVLRSDVNNVIFKYLI